MGGLGAYFRNKLGPPGTNAIGEAVAMGLRKLAPAGRAML
jgi:hypothetical protein